MEAISIETHAKSEFVDVSMEVATFLDRHADAGWKNGFVCVYCPHTTCGVTTNEGYDEDLQEDFQQYFARMMPEGISFKHDEGNADAHIKASLMGSSCLVPVDEDGFIDFGMWQKVFLCEFDGPRTRTLFLSFIQAQ